MGGIPEPDHRIGLGTFLTFDDIKFNVIAFFQSFVAVQLNCGIVDEYIRPVFTSDESVALGVIEPLDLPFILSHRLPPSLHREKYAPREGEMGNHALLIPYDVQTGIKVDSDYEAAFTT